MRRSLSALLTLSLVLSAAAAQAKGSKPEDVFGGSVKLSDKPFPTESRSASAYIAAVRKQSKDRFVEDAEKKGWKISYAAFFKKAVNDLEVTVKFYDVTDGGQRLVESYEQFLSERGQRVVIGTLKLKKATERMAGYDPNSKILMVIESKGKVVAKASFTLIGEGRKYKGKVEFTEEEAEEGTKEEE
jgi:hypothetical protein